MGLSESCFHRQRRLREKEGAGPRLLKLPFLLARWDWSIVSPASVKVDLGLWFGGVELACRVGSTLGCPVGNPAQELHAG